MQCGWEQLRCPSLNSFTAFETGKTVIGKGGRDSSKNASHCRDAFIVKIGEEFGVASLQQICALPRGVLG